MIRLPPTHIALEPPTSNPPELTAGTVLAINTKLRPVGIASSRSWLRTSRRELDCTSTTGVSPVTVIVSWTEPTFISALTGATKLASSTMPSRATVLNPGSVKVTV